MYFKELYIRYTEGLSLISKQVYFINHYKGNIGTKYRVY